MTMMAATTATRNRRPHTEMITAVARFTRSVSTRFQELTGPGDGYNCYHHQNLSILWISRYLFRFPHLLRSWDRIDS